MRRHDDAIRVLTWNVHSCIGSIGRFDPDAIVAALRELAPDVAALQEIDSRDSVARGVDTFRYLRSSLGWNAVEARTIRTDSGDYGHVVMTPWTIDAGRTFDISVDGFEPRAAISCSVRPLGLRVVATHLGLRARERRLQIGRIAAASTGYDHEPTIILGDFNEWRRSGVATRSLCPPFEPVAAMPSFPAWRPVFALDRIWCSPMLEIVGARAIDHMAHLSDHLPVLARISHRDSG